MWYAVCLFFLSFYCIAKCKFWILIKCGPCVVHFPFCVLIFVLYKYFKMYLCHDFSYLHCSSWTTFLIMFHMVVWYWNNSHSSEILFRYFICGGMERLVRILILQKRNYVRQIWLCLERYFTTHKTSILNYITSFWWWVAFFFSLWDWYAVLFLNVVLDTLTKQSS